MDSKTIGIVIACLIASSIEPILVKTSLLAGSSPFLLIILRMIVAGIAVGFLGGKDFFKQISFAQYKSICLVALLLFSTNSLVILALIFSNPSLVITVLTMTPVFVGLVSYFLGDSHVNQNFWIGLCICLFGVLFTVDAQLSLENFQNIKGLALAGLAVISSTSYRILLGKKTKLLPVKTITTYIFINNGLVAFCFLPFFYKDFNLYLGGISIWTGLAAVCANVAFVYGVKALGPARMSVIDQLQRPLVVLLSMFILSESPNFKQFIGMIGVFVGVYFVTIRQRHVCKQTA